MANKLNFYLNNTLVDICHSAKDLFLNYYNNNRKKEKLYWAT